MASARRALLRPVAFPREYKNTPPLDGQGDFAPTVCPNLEGEPLVGRLRTQPFASARAPANWARVAEFIKFIHAKRF